jgi:hypothetical protein
VPIGHKIGQRKRESTHAEIPECPLDPDRVAGESEIKAMPDGAVRPIAGRLRPLHPA